MMMILVGVGVGVGVSVIVHPQPPKLNNPQFLKGSITHHQDQFHTI
jgi:hypothetical protein